MLSAREAQQLGKKLAAADAALPRIFNALGDESRYRIFQILLEHRDLCVTEIARVVGISVPATSQQLKILENAGLIVRERRGQMICYRLPYEARYVRPVVRLVRGA